ncbi:glycoside hydrolase [Xylaria arbuscula]|nr:glycoside hydrolase [Xylaria arbuscula]
MTSAMPSLVIAGSILAMVTVPVASQTALEVIRISTTSNGFDAPARGWNSFGIQANPDASPSFTFDQAGVITQCDVLSTNAGLKASGYVYCSLDSGWSVGGNGDDFGRIIPDPSKFDIPALADHLHSQGLMLGVYVVPGAFIADEAKTILGTNVTIGSVCSGDNGLARCNFNYSLPEVQQWHNSVVDQFASWGVDFIKLDFITPGSPASGVNLPLDLSGEVIAYHQAIAQSDRQIRLDISWKLDRSEQFFDIWETNADSMRTDQDINNGGAATFVSWGTVQRAIDNYRQYITTVSSFDTTLTIYPDMDNLFVGNAASVSGITDHQRQTIMTHWIGAAANLIIGSDLTDLDDFGLNLLTNAAALEVADFTEDFPIQPQNPGTGAQSAQQLQAWIAGPSSTGEAVVIITNYSPNEGQGGFRTSVADLSIQGSFGVFDVWAGEDLGAEDTELEVQLEEGQSVLYHLNRSNLV